MGEIVWGNTGWKAIRLHAEDGSKGIALMCASGLRGAGDEIKKPVKRRLGRVSRVAANRLTYTGSGSLRVDIESPPSVNVANFSQSRQNIKSVGAKT